MQLENDHLSFLSRLTKLKRLKLEKFIAQTLKHMKLDYPNHSNLTYLRILSHSSFENEIIDHNIPLKKLDLIFFDRITVQNFSSILKFTNLESLYLKECRN